MRRAVGVIAAFATLAAVLGALAPSAEAALRLRAVAGGLNQPIHVASVPSQPGRIYVVERAGVIKVVERGRVRPTPFLDIRGRVSCCNGEQGLLSMAFHPSYARNGRAYVNYTNNAGDTRVVEFRADANRSRLLSGTARVVAAVEQPFANHNGGQSAFGPDGYLYIALGDGGGGGDPGRRAQNINTKLGKLLRVNVNVANAPLRIVGVGLRNPWRFSFDRANGNLWIGDVGQGRQEEVDFTRRSALDGAANRENYGWSRYEGRSTFDGSRPLYRPSRLVWPVHVYRHPTSGCRSITGGFVYRGPITGIRGRYFFGDFCTGAVWSFRYANGTKSGFRRERFTVPGLASFGEGPRAGLYLVSLSRGRVYLLSAA